MEGKIFKESENIYQDQAKVLYDYYKSAAEKIVNEERILEENIKHAEHQNNKYYAFSKKKKKLRTACILACLFFVLFAVAVAYYLGIDVSLPIVIFLSVLAVAWFAIALVMNMKVREFNKMIVAKHREITGYRKAHKDIFRDYRVTKMGVAYVPVAKRVAYNGKSFVVDQSGVTAKEKFTLQVIKRNEMIGEAVNSLHELAANIPIVDTSREPETVDTSDMSPSIRKVTFNDYFGKLDRTVRNISNGLDNVEEHNVELPIVFPNTDYANFLEDHMATDVKGAPVFEVFDPSRYDSEIQKFNEINNTRKALSDQAERIDSILKTLMVDMADTVQTTVSRRMASANSLIEYTNRIFYNILKSPYDFYSSTLEAEEIERISQENFDYEAMDYRYLPFSLRESSKLRLDLNAMNWVASDGSRTNVPFGISQIQNEIIAPIVSNLMKETSEERAGIYNHIKGQKLDYLNKWRQDTAEFYDRNRAEAADIINLMRSTMAEFSAAYNTLDAYRKTEENLLTGQTLDSAVTEAMDASAEILAGYQEQARQAGRIQQEFSEYIDWLHEDMDGKAGKYGYVEYHDASLRDKKARDTAAAADNVSALDERRRPLAEVNPLLALEVELPPVPEVGEAVGRYADIDLNELASEALEEIRKVETAPVVRDAVGNEPEADDEGYEVEAGGDEEAIVVADVDEIISDLLADDPDDAYSVRALERRFADLKSMDNYGSEEFYERMLDIYAEALEIEERIINGRGE